MQDKSKISSEAASTLGKASAEARRKKGFDYKAIAAKTKATIKARYGEGYYSKVSKGEKVKE